jgi:hypothetical protein
MTAHPVSHIRRRRRKAGKTAGYLGARVEQEGKRKQAKEDQKRKKKEGGKKEKRRVELLKQRLWLLNLLKETHLKLSSRALPSLPLYCNTVLIKFTLVSQH